MKILHIINDGLTDMSKRVIDMQSGHHDTEIVELFRKKVSYEAIIDKIFSCDRVISW